MSLEALIFDFDGTLADTEETHRQAFNDAFLRFGLKWEWPKPLYRELLKVSGGKERISRYIGTLPLSLDDKAQLRRLVPALHRTKTQLYAELIADGRCPLRPGVARLFGEARAAGARLSIVSTSASANVDALLARHLGRSWVWQFHSIVSADLVQHKKPAPDIYELALSTLGLPADRCVAFEDSLNGVRAAKAAGLFTVVAASQWTLGEDFTGADLELSHLGDAQHPLPPAQAAAVGGPWLGLAELTALHEEATRESASERART
ncbi:MAG TPA: HAD-IA family hydrolase [Casimicrobiaceae bacterium]